LFDRWAKSPGIF